MASKAHIIVLPGGGYSHHADHEGQPVVDWLNDVGVDASYFLYPISTPHPGPLEAVRAEVRRVRETGVEKVGLLGFSAGGHAAGLAALAPGDAASRVDAAILCYPVVSMQLETHADSRQQLIGLDASPELREETSVDRAVTDAAPPFFVWHTVEDAAVPVEHAYLLGQALAAHHISHAMHVFAHGRHGLGLAIDEGPASAWTTLCAEWLHELGWV